MSASSERSRPPMGTPSSVIGGVIVFLLVLCSSCSTTQTQPAASPTTAPTFSLPPTSSLYPPPGWRLVLNDSLQTSNGTWQEGPSSDGTSSCMFTANAYQISVSKPNIGYGCAAITSDYADFAFEVQMTIVKGEQGGMIFRSNPNATIGNEYYFHIYRRGAYKLDVYENYQPSKTLKSGTSLAIHTGLNQSNLVAVVAEGSTITLYVNYHQIASVDDRAYSHGRIGLIADTNGKPPTVVFYSNAKVWVPSS